jgi:hypothetical protein
MNLLARIMKIGCLLLALAAIGPLAFAQMEIGDDLKLNLNGTLGFGYGGSYGSVGQSGHNLDFLGSGNLSGSFYNPNFLSFSVQPFYNRNQANSASQSIFNESGVNSSANIFTGSKFPGFVAYGRNFNSSGEFGIPGLSGLTTDGSSHMFTIGWSALIPDLPTLSANYSTSGEDSSVVGANGDVHSATRTFNLNSNYRLAGFDLNGYYNHQSLDLSIPSFIAVDNAANNSSTSSSSYGIFGAHRLPLQGSFSATWNRTSFDSGTQSVSSNGSTDSTDAVASINPTTRLNLVGEVRYTSNLVGALNQSLINAGGPPVVLLGNGESHSFGTSGFANFNVGHGFVLHGRVSRQSQFFNGKNTDLTQYGGTVSYNYARPLFGLLYFSFGMVDNAQETGNSGLSFTGNVGIQKQFGRWETQADFSYAQNVQTLLLTYTTNNISYGGYVRRKLNMNTYLSGAFRAAQSGILQDQASTSRSNMFSSTLGWRGYTFTGNYSKSSGRTILTANGLLTPAPVPGVFDDNLVLFNGKSYSVGVGATPLRRMVVSFNYTNATSDTLSTSRFSVNDTQRYFTRLDYNIRKLVLRAGYTRAFQGISASGLPPTTINSYFVGISRWFNVF